MKYQCEVRELLSRVVVIEAPTAEAALELLEKKYHDNDFVLNEGDFTGEPEFEVLEDSVPDDFEVDYEVNENVAGTPNAFKRLFDSLPKKDKRRE